MKKQLSVVSCQLSVKKSLVFSLLFLILLFIFTSSFFAVGLNASTVDNTIEHIQKKYNEINDVQGEFFQTSYIKDLERIERYEGKFFIKKPSSMRWIFSKPRDEEVIIRESNIWINKRSEKQAIKSTFSKDAYSQVPIALLNSLGNLKADFDIRLIKDETLELIPKRRTGFINKILLEVNIEDFPVKTFSIFDVNGNKIDVTLKDVKINLGIKDSFFIFNPSPDVEVFDFSQ